MNKNWTVSNGTLYRANHNGTSKGYAIGSVKYITESQIAAIVKTASTEKTIKEKIEKAKNLLEYLKMKILFKDEQEAQDKADAKAVEEENKMRDQEYLIISTGMKLYSLAKLFEIPLDTMKSYSAGRRTMPAELIEKIENMIKKIKN